MQRFHYLVFAILASCWPSLISSAFAQTPTVYIPEPLKPWTQWVLEHNPERGCSLLREEKVCVWPGRLSLDLTAKGGSFHFEVSRDVRGEIELPGGPEVFPTQLGAQNKNGSQVSVPFLLKEGKAFAQLEAGTYELRGSFSWDQTPKSISVPVELGLIDLQLNGKKIANPKLSEEGELWLEEETQVEETEGDSLQIEMFRKLVDNIPFQIETLLRLRISGKAREIDLGKILPGGFTPISLETDLPYQLSDDFQLKVQSKPGVFDIRITAFQSKPPDELAPITSNLPEWPAEEVWAWQPQEDFRTVEISGGVAIDPQRTSIPDEWRGLSTYLMAAKDVMTFKETRRGLTDQAPNSLSLMRRFWLDLDGKGFTVQDNFSGTMNQGWRLQSAAGLALGRVQVNGQDQLVTKDPNSGTPGVELRSQALSLVANSRYEGERSAIPAIGWAHSVQSLNASLLLPPGWTLFDANSVDIVGGSWLRSWTLLDVFIVLMVTVAVQRLLGYGAAGCALCALVLSHLQVGAPFRVWFHLLASLALMRYLPQGTVKRYANTYFILTLLTAALMLVGFSVEQLRSGIFPHTGQPAATPNGIFEFFFEIVEHSLLGWLATAFFLVTAYHGARAVLERRFWSAIKLVMLSVAIIFAALAAEGFNESFGGRQVQYEAMNAPVAASPQGVFEDNKQYLESKMDESYSSTDKSVGGALLSRKRAQQVFAQDPKAVIQTGPGLPSWNWNAINIRWNGPVQEDQTFGLLLFSPWENFLLSWARVLLFMVLIWYFSRELGAQFPRMGRWAVTAIAFVCLNLFKIADAQAQEFPPTQILDELEKRLNQDVCDKECTSTNSMELVVQRDHVEMRAEVSSRGVGAFPIPGPLDQFFPGEILLDGLKTSSLRRDETGLVWVRVPAGSHEVRIRGELASRDVVTLQLGRAPLHIEVKAPGWDVDGVTPQKSVEDSIQLTRTLETKVDKEADLSGHAAELLLPSWYTITRELILDLPWRVQTTVSRSGNTERPQVVKINLLDGESVNSEVVKLENGKAVLSFARDATEIIWESTLDQKEALNLNATTENNQTEVWKLSCSPVWRCENSGLAPRATIQDGQHAFLWYPYPGEAVSMRVGKPFAAEGKSKTIDSAVYSISVGDRVLSGSIVLSIRASQGGFEALTLPQGAALKRVMISGKDETTRFSGENLSLPITPGSTSIEVQFELVRDISTAEVSPPIKIGDTIYNGTITLSMPISRWTLWLSGPEWGPAVLFWSRLIVVILCALVLSWASFSPLGLVSWVLLGLGIAMLPLDMMIIPVLWFALLEVRKRHAFSSRLYFNTFQLILAGTTLLTLRVIFHAVRVGLLVSPRMMIRGNGSSNSLFRWYVDVAHEEFPQVHVWSLPLWAWQAFMVLWSLWIVFAVLRWLRYAFDVSGKGGLWMKAAG